MIGWILGILGIGGLAGFGALAFFAPQTIGPILEVLKAGLDALLKIASAVFRFVGWAFSGWPLRAYVTLLVLLLAVFGSTAYLSGQRGWDGAIAWEARQQRTTAAATKAVGEKFTLQLAATDINIKFSLSNGTRQLDRTFARISKEVPVHVTPEIDHHYPLPCGVIRVWDAGYYRVDPAAIASSKCPSDAARAPVAASAFSSETASLWGDYWRLKKHDDAVMQMYAALAKGYQKMREQLIELNAGRHG